MKHIFIIIGGANFGKTILIKKLSKKKDSILNMSGKNISLITRRCSEQELLRIFCDYQLLIDKRIKKLIKIFERKSKNKDNSALVIPFTLQLKKGTRELGKNCIIEPLNYLKRLYPNDIHVIHLKRIDKSSEYNKRIEINNFISQNTNPELSLNSNMQDNQAENVKQLREFIIRTFD